MERILVTGACGQIGSELTPALRKKYGAENVLATDIRMPSRSVLDQGPFEFLNIMNTELLEDAIWRNKITRICNLAAVRSAKGEKKPEHSWNVNVNGLKNVLEVSRANNIREIFWPSSIAVFGPETPRENAPQTTVLRPTTMSGINKVAGELLCMYYSQHYDLDVRGLRFPGIISSETLPGGGVTDYAVEIFYEAVKKKEYTCFLKEDTFLPMMYMPDCIKATIEIIEADPKKLSYRFFNLTAMSFTPKDLAAEIKKYIPEFKCEYKPDFRQEIADSLPNTIDDSVARKEWGWKPEYDLKRTTKDMIEKLSAKLK